MQRLTLTSISFALLSTYGGVVAAQTAELSAVSVVEQADTTTAVVTSNTRNEPRDVKNLLKDEPGVGVINTVGSRAGNNSINIRGLSGNRVAMSLDGIPLPEGQEESNARFATLGQVYGRAEMIETSGLKSAYINKNGSAGSLAGGVDFRTLSPDDLLKGGKVVGGFSNTAYHSADRSLAQTLAAAAQNDRWKALVLGTYRTGNETYTYGKEKEAVWSGQAVRGALNQTQARTKADPADKKTRYVLAKVEFKANERHRFETAFEQLWRSTYTDVLSQNGNNFTYAYQPMSARAVQGIAAGFGLTSAQAANLNMISGLYATQQRAYTDDRIERYRVALTHHYDNHSGFIQKITSTLFFQNAEITNFHLREGADSDGIARRLFSQSHVQDRSIGGKTEWASPLSEHNVIRYGVSAIYSDLSNNLFTSNRGTQSPNPDANVWNVQAYLEDEWALGNVYITPHLGYAFYRFRPETGGNYYGQDAAGVQPAKRRTETAWLPRLTLEWRVAPLFKPYVKYAAGIKMPSSQMLVMSYSGTAGYAAVGNPDLKPEKSQTVELGVKGDNGRLTYELAGYYSRYKDFLSNDSYTTAQYPIGVFSFINKDKVRIYGVEAKTRYALTEALSAKFSVAYNKAEDDKGDLQESQPLTYKAGLAYDRDAWGANVDFAYVQNRLGSDISGNESGFYGLVDIAAYWKPVKNLMLSAGIDNLFNRKYWDWNDISARVGSEVSPITRVNADAYTATGRSYNAALRYEF